MTVTKRIDTARGHWYKLDGERCDGVTTVINNGLPKPALAPWAAKEAAAFTADNLETLLSLDRDARIDLVKGAPWRDRDKAARRGTEVHGLAERIIRGEEVDVPEELDGHVTSYIRFLEDFNVQPVLTEAVVGNRTHRWMGTIDGIADFSDGLRRLYDIKTTRSGIFPETAIQVGTYRQAEFYLDADGNEQPMIAVDACAAVWVRADGYDMVPLDTTHAYRIFRHAQQISLWQNVTSKEAVGDVIQPPKEAA